MKVGVLGSGIVGETLANGFIKHGHSVMRGSRTPEKLKDWAAASKGQIGTFQECAAFGDLVVLAVKGTAAEATIKLCGNLDGKVVIDTCNPIEEVAPVNGVLRYFTNINDSLMERLQKAAPKANFVKCFSSVGSAHMVNPKFAMKPSMFICGNSDAAKGTVREVLGQFGWETEDMGAVEAARAIEPLCMLYCIPGIRSQQWNHAFKLLRS